MTSPCLHRSLPFALRFAREARAATLLPALALALASSHGTCADTLHISDGTFADAQWTLVPNPYGPFGGGGAGVQVATGGNGVEADGGPARLIENSCGPNLSGSYNASIFTGYVYNPATQGPITSIALSIDSRYTTGLCAIGGVVEQGGAVWMFDYQINSSGWQTFPLTPASGWYQILPTGTFAGPGPDLTAAGAPMRFGFWTGNGSGAGSGGYATQSLYDNFSVTIEHAPGPCPADLNHDGIVDGGDLGILLGQWSNMGSADLNHDGMVDGADLGALLGAWGACA